MDSNRERERGKEPYPYVKLRRSSINMAVLISRAKVCVNSSSCMCLMVAPGEYHGLVPPRLRPRPIWRCWSFSTTTRRSTCYTSFFVPEEITVLIVYWSRPIWFLCAYECWETTTILKPFAELIKNRCSLRDWTVKIINS